MATGSQNDGRKKQIVDVEVDLESIERGGDDSVSSDTNGEDSLVQSGGGQKTISAIMSDTDAIPQALRDALWSLVTASKLYAKDDEGNLILLSVDEEGRLKVDAQVDVEVETHIESNERGGNDSVSSDTNGEDSLVQAGGGQKTISTIMSDTDIIPAELREFLWSLVTASKLYARDNDGNLILVQASDLGQLVNKILDDGKAYGVSRAVPLDVTETELVNIDDIKYIDSEISGFLPFEDVKNLFDHDWNTGYTVQLGDTVIIMFKIPQEIALLKLVGFENELIDFGDIGVTVITSDLEPIYYEQGVVAEIKQEVIAIQLANNTVEDFDINDIYLRIMKIREVVAEPVDTADNDGIEVPEGSDILILASNPHRMFAHFVNDSDTVIYLSYGPGAALLHQGIRLNPEGGNHSINMSARFTGEVRAVHGGTGAKNLTVVEG